MEAKSTNLPIRMILALWQRKIAVGLFFLLLFYLWFGYWTFQLGVGWPPLSLNLVFCAYLPYGGGVLFLVYMTWHTWRYWYAGNERGAIAQWSAANGWISIWPGERLYIERRKFDPALRNLLKKLHSENPDVRAKAKERLRAEGISILPMLRAHSREEGDIYRQEILNLIEELHPDGLLAGLLEGFTTTDDPHEHWQLCKCIRDLEIDRTPAIPVLIQFLTSNSLVADRAEAPLFRIGFEAMIAMLPLLMRNDLNRGDLEGYASNIAEFLKFEKRNEVEMRQFTEAIAAISADPRCATSDGDHWLLYILAEVGPKLRDHCDALRAIADDPTHRFHHQAIQSLRLIDADEES